MDGQIWDVGGEHQLMCLLVYFPIFRRQGYCLKNSVKIQKILESQKSHLAIDGVAQCLDFRIRDNRVDVFEIHGAEALQFGLVFLAFRN